MTVLFSKKKQFIPFIYQFNAPAPNLKYLFLHPNRYSMNKSLSLFCKLLFVISFTIVFNPAANGTTPAFPGAEGFGRFTTGGRGGAVYRVTKLTDDGSEGTFRYAVTRSGARTVVFDVSGTIFLTSALSISNPNITIAGQTAPGDGICIADYPFTINTNNVIIRFMRFRLGNRNVAYHEGDGLGGMDGENIMVDHCSVSWSIDECLSVYGSKNLTVQWCIASQSLRNAGHVKGAHGYGGNWGGSGASYHHNLICHNESRTPRLGPRAGTQTDERMDMRNNVIYNWGGNGCYGGEGMNVNIVNNYYKPGPLTKTKSANIQYRIAAIGIRTTEYVTTYPAFAPMWHVWGDYYVNGNYIKDNDAVTADNWTNGIYAQINNSTVDNTFTQTTKDTLKLAAPINFRSVTTHTAEMAYDRVLSYAGASYRRDALDAIMVNDTRNGVATYTGVGSGLPGIIDTQEDLKPANAASDWSPWPTLASTAAPTDSDLDGMPDVWETANGLNPNDASDRNRTNAEGYTMLEVYMNSIVQSIMDGGNAGGSLIQQGYPETTPATLSYTLATTTYNNSPASTTWAFLNGITVTNSNAKGYSSGSESGIKYSKDTEFTINLLEGMAVDSVKFEGYDNYDTADSYLSKLNGVSFATTDYVYTKKNASGNYVVCSHTFSFSNPVTGSLAFTFGGNQVVMKITLYYHNQTTDNKTIAMSPLDPNGLTNVYALDGKLVKSNVVRRYSKNNLPKGFYVIDKQKIVIGF